MADTEKWQKYEVRVMGHAGTSVHEMKDIKPSTLPIMRKQTFCIFENKGTDELTAKLIKTFDSKLLQR